VADPKRVGGRDDRDPGDILKVAKPFVDGLVRGGRESSFVGMILHLARPSPAASRLERRATAPAA
jgi:hypothetical protein